MTNRTKLLFPHSNSSLLHIRPFALYIHWPFCKAKCPYCDFNSHVDTQVDVKAFGDALCEEMTYMKSLMPKHPALSSMFFGGGTPSLMPPWLIERLITHAQKLFGFMSNIEITAEANPTSIETEAMLNFRQVGVTRVSMGIQSLDDNGLKFLGREHSVFEALSALDKVCKAFDRVSIDLIYASPNQSPKAWHDMLSQALSFGLGHLSLYQLTIEPGTVFHTRKRKGEVMALDNDQAANLYEITQKLTLDAGMPAYEISNHATAKQECRHNLTYWQAGDWIGIGPGAHGRFAKFDSEHNCIVRAATKTRNSPAGWLSSVVKNGHGIEVQEVETLHDWANEMVMMGLRLTKGINLNSIERLCGPINEWLDFDGVARGIDAGWLHHDPVSSTLMATPDGRIRLNFILSIILR